MKLFLSLLFFSSLATASSTILLIGFWPPTNEMIRRFSPDVSKNPQGWLGKNYNGSGFDIIALFPEYNSENDDIGTGDFQVDYTSTYNDFMKYTQAYNPIALIGFGRGGSYSWNIERFFFPYHFSSMFQAGILSSRIGVEPLYPFPITLQTAQVYTSTLPEIDINNAVNNIGITSHINETGPGNYLCGFLSYLIGWYQSQHSSITDPNPTVMAGFIHVNTQKEPATQATAATLEVIIRALQRK